jgi:hypothetical protein
VPSRSPSIASTAVGTPEGHSRLESGADGEGDGLPSPLSLSGGGGERRQKVDWRLGELPPAAPDPGQAAGEGGGPDGGASGRGTASPGGGGAQLYCLLAKLYCAARTELLRLGLMAGLEVPECAATAGLDTEPHSSAAAAADAAPDAPVPGAAADSTATVQPPPPPHIGAAPSGTDMTQVELESGSLASSASEAQQAQQALAAVADGRPASGPVTLENAPEGPEETTQEPGAGAGQAGGLPPRLALRPKAAAGEGGERRATALLHPRQRSLFHPRAAACCVACPHPRLTRHAPRLQFRPCFLFLPSCLLPCRFPLLQPPQHQHPPLLADPHTRRERAHPVGPPGPHRGPRRGRLRPQLRPIRAERHAGG